MKLVKNVAEFVKKNYNLIFTLDKITNKLFKKSDEEEKKDNDHQIS